MNTAAWLALFTCSVIVVVAEQPTIHLHQALASGAPHEGTLHSTLGDLSLKEEPRFFKVVCDVDKSTPTNLIVHARVPEGEAMLYVSTTGESSPADHQWQASIKPGSDFLSIPNDHAMWPHENGVFYVSLWPARIGVDEPKIPFNFIKGNSDKQDPFTPRSYAIQADCITKQEQEHKLASVPSTAVANVQYDALNNGVPTRGDCGQTDGYYSVYVEFGDVRINVDPIVGDPDLYITTSNQPCTPGINCYKWRAFKFGADAITILATDHNYCNFCTYHIAVHSYLSHAATFDITATIGGGSVTTLRDGVPETVSLYDMFQDKQFKYQNPDFDGVVTISITAISGDPDLYVSTSPNPGPHNYQWYSNRIGSDTVVITNATHNNDNAVFYINIHNPRGHDTNCSGVLVAHVQLDAIQLENGVTMSGEVSTLGTEYYSIEVLAAGAPFSDTISEPHYQDGESVNLMQFNFRCRDAPAPFNHFRGSDVSDPPGNFHATWAHHFDPQSDVTAARLSFGMDDIDSFWPGDQCHLFTVAGVDLTSELNSIWEEADIKQAHYYVTEIELTNYPQVLSAIEGGLVQIELELQGHGSVTNGAGLDYSRITVNPDTASTNHVNLTLDLTVVEGHCRMKVGRSFFPNNTYFDNQTYSWESVQEITIVNASQCPNEESCMFYIGVMETYGSNCTFELTASTQETGSNRSHIQLLPDVPVQTSVDAREYAYFTYESDDNDADIIFTVTAVSGDPDLCANEPCEFTDCAFPTITNADKTSNRFGDDVVTFNGTEAETGTYYIGVYGFVATEFIITATTSANNSNVSDVLVDGIPQTGNVEKNDYVYFRFEVPEQKTRANLSVSVEAALGPASIEVVGSLGGRNIPYPTVSSRVWHGDSGFTIDFTQAGTYVFGVFGHDDTDFTITAYTNGTLVELIDGEDFQDNITGKLALRYYFFDVLEWNDASKVKVTVTAAAGSDPDIYMTFGNYTHPSNNHYFWKGIKEGTDAIEISSTSSPPACGSCTYFIGVQCVTSECNYRISASYNSTVDDEAQIIPFESMRGYLQPNEETYYRVAIPSWASNVRISLTGNFNNNVPQLFVATAYAHPSATHNLGQGTLQGSAVIYDAPSNCGGEDCTYHLTVQAGSKVTFYQAVVTYTS